MRCYTKLIYTDINERIGELFYSFSIAGKLFLKISQSPTGEMRGSSIFELEYTFPSKALSRKATFFRKVFTKTAFRKAFCNAFGNAFRKAF